MLNTLIAEDDPACRHVLHRWLAGHFPSMRLAEAADGEGAMRKLGARHFDLIFMDIHLPRGHEFVLTQAIRLLFADAVICAIADDDGAEHRNAALRYGADRFMARDALTEAEIVGLVESLLRPRFTTLVVDSGTLTRRQIDLLFSVRWPEMNLAAAPDAATGIGQALALQPDLVLLELDLPDAPAAEVARRIRAASPHATVVGMAGDALPATHATAARYGVDDCVPVSPAGYTALTGVVNALQPRRTAIDGGADRQNTASTA